MTAGVPSPPIQPPTEAGLGLLGASRTGAIIELFPGGVAETESAYGTWAVTGAEA